MEDLSKVLNELHVATRKGFVPTTFDQRLRIQKCVYMLKAFGHPVAQEFEFGTYFHGPYSPGLARVYYGKKQAAGITGRANPQAENTALVAVAEAASRGNLFLEALATLHSVASLRGLGKSEAMGVVESLKPHVKGDLEDAWAYLVQFGLVDTRTSTR